MKGALLLAVLAFGAAGGAQAQGGRADGVYPSTLFCEAGPGGPASRDAMAVLVEGGRASYRFRAGGVAESGGGPVVGGRVQLDGQGRGPSGAYTARYAGEIGGRGGLLTGAQVNSRGGRRACQMAVGIGRD